MPPQMKRWYNGPRSVLMDMIYDRLVEHIDIADFKQWPIISLYLAREIKRIEEHDIIFRSRLSHHQR